MHLGNILAITSVLFLPVLTGQETKGTRIRILSWNINKGKQLSDITEVIQRSNADLCFLQEVDANARRTHNVFVTDKLGHELGYLPLFTPAFQELAQGGAEPAEPRSQSTICTWRAAAVQLATAKSRRCWPMPPATPRLTP